MILRALALSALATPAGAFDLAFPLDCTLGESCYIQQFADHDPGSGAEDFSCGGLSYDGHDGTDFALPTRAAMAAGVEVRAAAPGVVTAVRDGLADFAGFPPGQDCGNGVVLDHGDGWETQYCHLKQGSVAVKPGEDLAAGAVLGQVGQSGNAAFPHLHLSLRHQGVVVDPFAPEASLAGPAATCGAVADDLWQTPLPYRPGGLLGIGIAPDIPEFDAIKAGLASPDLPATAPALVIWVYLFASRPGDALLFTLTGPGGEVLTERSSLERAQTLAFRAVGKRLRDEAWPAGLYSAEVRMMRRGAEIGRQSLTIRVGGR